MPKSSKAPVKKITFEEAISTIDSELKKRQSKWTLASLTWISWEDCAQIIRLHIWKKWHLYDPARSLEPWLNRIISNQIKNLIRNLYSNYARPCLKCAAATDTENCSIYVKQCDTCPLFAYWKKRKQPATHIRLPVSIENHSQEVKSIFDENMDVSKHIEEVHERMKEILKANEWLVYEGLFILHKEESQIAKELGFISNEKGREPGHKQIKNIRKAIIIKARKCIADGDIDII